MCSIVFVVVVLLVLVIAAVGFSTATSKSAPPSLVGPSRGLPTPEADAGSANNEWTWMEGPRTQHPAVPQARAARTQQLAMRAAHLQHPAVPQARAARTQQPAAPQTRAATPPGPRAKWVPPGEAVEVAGFSIPGGMLYFGTGLPPIKEWRVATEPALINPGLRVQTSGADLEGKLLSYWPSYTEIHPTSRAAYLTWLAGGRCAPDAAIGFVFLFFYGLERRLLFDHAQSPIPPAEREAIQSEVERLLQIYGHSNSFRRYASTLHGLGFLLRGSVDTETLAPPRHRDGWELPLVTRLTLGVLATEGKRLPAEWAHSWVLTAPDFFLRTPAQRCPEEFSELFRLRYQESFGEGLPLRPNKTLLKVEYQPASASFGGVVALTTDLPDIARTTATFDRLRSLAEQCTQELDPYSRWVGRTGETASPPAVALLPAPLARGRGNEATRALGDWLETRLGGQNLTLIDSVGLLAHWPSKDQARPSRRELETLSEFLASRGFGIEPDIALGGSALSKSQSAALFRLPGGIRDKPSPAYQGASVLLHLAATVAAADGEVSMAEERHLIDHLDKALNLPVSDRVRLEAHFRWLAEAPPSLARSKKAIEGLSQDERRGIAAFLISLAGADGHLAPAEMAALSKIYPLLGLEPQSLYADVHQLMSSQVAPAEEPVSVRPAEVPKGYGISPPAKAKASPQGIELDLAKVRAKLSETERVSRLLGEIFVDEESSTPAPPPTVKPAADDFAIAGLDGAHSALLLRLGGAPSWERAQVERLADALGLLPDGALEVINEAAIKACGAPLLEGDELIELDSEILQEMLS